MLAPPLRFISIVCSLLIATSFLLFVIQETGNGEKEVNSEIAGQTIQAGPPHKKHQPRRFIDGASHTLTTPFNHIDSSDSSTWVRHLIPAILGLLLYGFLLSFIARYAAGWA